MAPARFVELFPEQEGYQLLLVETPPGRDRRRSLVESRMRLPISAPTRRAPHSVSQRFTASRTRICRRFQTLGGLGLLLGTVGLATVMLRNAVERRREMGLLGAVGYQRRHFLMMAAAENALLLTGGLVAGACVRRLRLRPPLPSAVAECR